jgi:hypothetical protein
MATHQVVEMFLNIHCSLKKIAAEVDTLRRHKPVAKLCDDATDRQSVAGLARDMRAEKIASEGKQSSRAGRFRSDANAASKIEPDAARRSRSKKAITGVAQRSFNILNIPGIMAMSIIRKVKLQESKKLHLSRG